MGRPRILDLFCGGGGSAVGYHRAGFDVTGIDIKPQPHYPFEFYQYDALKIPLEAFEGFDAVHASPPCQHYSPLAGMHPKKDYPDLLDQTRDLMIKSGILFVIENVVAAHMLKGSGPHNMFGFTLCGTSFGLGAREMELRRHRQFEVNFPISQIPPCNHKLQTIGVYGHSRHKNKPRMASAAEAREALGIDWMNRDEMAQAIPPAYCQFIGEQLMRMVRPSGSLEHY